MTNERVGVPSDVIGQRVRQLRNRRGWTAADLAKRVADAGGPEISKQQMFNIEGGRRDAEGNRRRSITVEELMALALVLDVAPVHLMIPLESTSKYPVTSDYTVVTQSARNWFRGQDPLPEMDERIFFSEVPSDEFRVMRVADINRAEQGESQ